MEPPTEITAIATTAANAVVGAMTTDSWNYLRGRCADLFRRFLPGHDEEALHRLDNTADGIASAPDTTREVLTEAVAGDFARVAAASEEAAAAVRALAEEAASTKAETGGVANQNLSLSNIRAGGDFTFGGRDVNIRKER